MARGRCPKKLRVKPPRFLGERLEGLGTIAIPGHAPVKLEIYLAGDLSNGDAARPLAVYAAGTLVTESFSELSAIGLDREPWTDTRLTGMVDFPELRVAPGSRRGVVPDEMAHAFAQALLRVEPLLISILETKDRERAETIDQNLIRDLQRAFRDFYRKRPSYTMLPTEKKTEGAGVDGAAPGEDASAEPAEEDVAPGESGADTAELFPPGPLATVSISADSRRSRDRWREDRPREREGCLREENCRGRRFRLADLGAGRKRPQRSRPRRCRRVRLPRGRDSFRPREGARDRKRSLGGGAGRGRGDPPLERERGDSRARARRRSRRLLALAPSRRPLAGQQRPPGLPGELGEAGDEAPLPGSPLRERGRAPLEPGSEARGAARAGGGSRRLRRPQDLGAPPGRTPAKAEALRVIFPLPGAVV